MGRPADTEQTSAIDRPVAATAAAEATGTKIYVNLAMPESAERVAAQDVDGVGLLRAEFMVAEALRGGTRVTHGARRAETARRRDGGIGWRIAAAFTPRPVVYRASTSVATSSAVSSGGETFEPVEAQPDDRLPRLLPLRRATDLFRLELDVLARVARDRTRTCT